MSEVRLVVREAHRDWSGTIPASCADRAIAALAADPTTLAELEVATERFAKRIPDRPFYANLTTGSNDVPYDAGLVVLDLFARLIVVESTYSSPGPNGTVEYHDGRCSTETGLPYHLAEDWRFSHDGHHWRIPAEGRRRERKSRPTPDARSVFYGRPLLEFVARETHAAFAAGEEIPGATTRIHAAWLLTPRADLGGACPREIALERREHLSRDLQHRCEFWSSLGHCPRGLDESSHAFRFGGFGTHELVMYYELVRLMMGYCFERLAGGMQADSFAVGDFLSAEVPRLENLRDAWLDAPHPEFHGRTPRSIVDRERARLPEGMSGHDAIVDPDCPCCQMMADMPGPAFWHLDGCNMDDDFAFDIYHRTRDEWEAERRKWEAHDAKFEAEWAERKRIGVDDRSANAIWSRSASVGDTADVPLGIRVFGIGCRLAELIVGLRAGADGDAVPSEIRRHIDQLNRDFGNLREILANADLAEALIEPVLDRFLETLSTVSSARPELAAQCESLGGTVRKLLDPRDAEPTWDSRDPDIPF